MRKMNIFQSENCAPNDTNCLWLNGRTLLMFGVNGWEKIGEDTTPVKEATLTEAGLVMKANAETQLKTDATLSEVINKVNSVIVKLKASGAMA